MKKEKIGIRIRFKGGLNKDLSPDMWGTIELFKNCESVGNGAGFTISEEKIYVDTLDVDEEFQRMGYGTLIIDIIKGIAELLEKPIHIYSINHSYPFYESQGFVSVFDPEMRRRIIIKRGSKPSGTDYIWIPESVNNKVKKFRMEL